MEEVNIRNYKSVDSFADVLSVIRTYISKSEDIEFITRAFEFANELHKDQKWKSGEPYINHCLSVTKILAQYQSAPATLAAGLLHDTMEDCGVTYQEIKTKFNEDVADIVQALTKIKNLPNVSAEETSAHARAPGSMGSVAVARGLNCPVACGILPDQGSDLCPLHW